MNPGTRRGLAVVISVMCLSIAAGCATWQRIPPPPAEPQPALSRQLTVERAPPGEWVSDHYTDLPIPRGYQYKPDESFVFAQEGLRSADLFYEGNLAVEELIRFYQESMPTNGWKFLRLTGVRMKTITFAKDAEMCEIIIMTGQQLPRVEESEWRTSPRVATHLHIKVNPS